MTNDNITWVTKNGVHIPISSDGKIATNKYMNNYIRNKGKKNETNEKKGKEYRSKLKSLKGKEDGTYDLDTGKKVDFKNKGFNVSFEQSTDNFTDSQYYDKISECRQKCDGKVYGGVFGGDPEISFYTEDLKTAKEIMYKYNQHIIWSNELQDIIKNERYKEKQN